LPSKRKALNSNPSTTKKEKKKDMGVTGDVVHDMGFNLSL
jgi:hypothetical protein